MEPVQAAKLGQRIRLRRQQLGLSIRDLADRAGMNLATVWRIEQGRFAAPSPDKLARLAKALGLATAELFSLANYTVPDLPSFQPYLRSRYADMPAAAIDELDRAFARISKKHGYDPGAADVANIETETNEQQHEEVPMNQPDRNNQQATSPPIGERP